MSNIFEIQQKYLDLIYSLEDAEGELSPELEASLAINEDEFLEKAKGYRNIIKQYDSDIQGIDTEVKRLQALKKSKLNTQEKLEYNLDQALVIRGLTKLDLGNGAAITYRKSTSVEVDMELLGKEWKKTKTEITADKVELAKALKAGEEIDGAVLKENQNIQIK